MLSKITMKPGFHDFRDCDKIENEKIIHKELFPEKPD